MDLYRIQRWDSETAYFDIKNHFEAERFNSAKYNIATNEMHMFRVGIYPFKIWLYVLKNREAIEASHRQIATINREVDTIFDFIRTGLEYGKIELHAKILAELVRGTWIPDKLHDYLKMLFLLSGPEE